MEKHLRKKNDSTLISEKLALLQKRLMQQNKTGLYNLSRYTEDIICRLLNLAFGWQLVNLNDKWPNCPAIDLADRERGVCVQVTTAKGKGRVVDTLKGLDKYHKDIYSRVLIFYLQVKPSSIPEQDPRLELWDLADLQAMIAECPKITLSKLLAMLQSVEDMGLLTQQSNLRTENPYFTPKLELIKHTDFGQHMLISQLERVRLTAFIPLLENMSCKIEFARQGTTDAHITFDQETILEILFSGHGSPPDKRSYFRGVDQASDTAILQLGNCRYFVDTDTALQLNIVVDNLYNAYKETRRQTCTTLGIEGFSVLPSADWKQPIFRLPLFLWNEMWQYAQRHDAYAEQGQWDLFDHAVPASIIRIIRNPGGDEYGKSTLAELHITEQDPISSLCTVSWKRGYAFSQAEWQGYDNVLKWQAAYTAYWVWEKWMPYLCKDIYQRQYPRSSRSWKLFKKSTPALETFTKELLGTVTLFF